MMAIRIRTKCGWQVTAAMAMGLACAGGALTAQQAPPASQPAPSSPQQAEAAKPRAITPAAQLSAEKTLAATVSETRMVDTVRTLVGFGTRMYGTPSNHAAAAWLAASFKDAGLDVTIHKDAARDWYQPVSWTVSVSSTVADPASAASFRATTTPLTTTWPASGAPSATGAGPLSLTAAAGAVCLASTSPTPESTAGCLAVLLEGRATASGWPVISRVRGAWTIPIFVMAPKEAAALRDRLSAGDKLQVTFELESKSGKDSADTVIATLPGRDHSKYILFCAHGDSDSGGPGANDNASGVSIVLEIARTAAAAIKAGKLAQPAWDLRFVSWGGEMTSTREYLSTMSDDPSKLQAVINFDQSGFGSSKDALYVEPDDIAVNAAVIAAARGVMQDHVADGGFPQHAASVKTQGGTDSYVFQNTRTPNAPLYPAITFYTSAWDKPQAVKMTDGFPPINWYADEKPGIITVDGDPFYHSVGDTPANTTDTEPANMGWCARVGLISAWRLMDRK